MSNTIAQSLLALDSARDAIASAIAAKGVTVLSTDGFYEFASLISVIGTTNSPSRPSSPGTGLSINSCLSYLSTARDAIASAITAKGVTVSSSDGFSDFASLIALISTGVSYTASVTSSVVTYGSTDTSVLSYTTPTFFSGTTGKNGITIVVDTRRYSSMFSFSLGYLYLKKNGVTQSVTYTKTADYSGSYLKVTYSISAANTSGWTSGSYTIELRTYITASGGKD